MTPVEALEGAIGHGLLIRFNRHLWHRYPPGSVISKLLSAEQRAALSKLTAGDIRSIRQDVVAAYLEPVDTTFREMKLRFDRTLRCTRRHDPERRPCED